ncbi:TPA: hypothetical protein PTV45_000570 [Clostridium botulinum]|nr:hypothetical protein [Clostridium botulinum]
MGNLKDILENIYYVEDLKEIAEEVNRNDFLDIVSDEEFEYCPGHMELCNTEDCHEGCGECWENAIKNIKFKGGHDMKNKIDYDREYNIYEIFEFDEGIEFKHNNYMYRIMEGLLEVKYYNTNKEWIQCNCIDKCIINAKFKLVKKDKKVSFEEAIQAYLKSKDIKCIWNDETTIYSDGFLDSDNDKLTMGQILKGEWYIKED